MPELKNKYMLSYYQQDTLWYEITRVRSAILTNKKIPTVRLA